jgi:diketogulonate reductase-like aldo/keto reductase
LLEHPAVVAAASKHGVSAAAVLLRWALQKDYCIIPKSRDATRIDANAQLDFALLDDEMAALDALDCGGMAGRLCWRRDEMRMLDFP